jgi:putative endopeptidase
VTSRTPLLRAPRAFKPLAIAFAITAALAACTAEPAPEAAAPAAAPPARTITATITATTPAIRFQASDVDASIPVCQDLAGHVNSRWLAANPVPADKTTWGSFEILQERSFEIQRALVEDAGADAAASGTRKLIGDIWATGMDEAAVNAAGLAPIQAELDAIAAITDPASLAAYLRQSNLEGRGVLFGFGPQADFNNPELNIAYATQGGLGLPDRDYYTGDRADYVAAREAYRAHIAAILALGGASAEEAAAQAQAVFDLEARLASKSLSSAELSRDVSLYYNPVTVAEADAISPNFPWSALFEHHGVAAPAMFSLAQPDFHAELSAMIAELPAATWQAYLRFHAIDNAAPYLADAFAEENFNFYGRTLRGQQEMRPRWQRVLGAVNGTVGEALGQEYVEVAFTPEAKARMEQLVANLSEALKVRIENLEWMSEETKAKALEKWASFTPKIGYPDRWRSWEGLSTSRESYAGNLMAANAFNYRFELAKIGQPVDRSEWGMTPQTVNAYYNPLANEIVFPAAILQPPFFDLAADDALNYGGIGAVIGHEMIHGYDDQGSRFGPTGKFENWWTDGDMAAFTARTGQLVEQFDAYESIDGLHVNGTLTLGENIADLGGLTVAHAAYLASLGGNEAPVIDGYTGEQRLFLNWATVWRRGFKDEELKVRLTTDSHAPANFRAIGAPSNMASFQAAFGCATGDAMVREGEQRISIW